MRHPASACGIVGLKPTYGLVSRRGVFPLSFTLDHVGPMARNAADAALLLEAMAGHDPADPGSAPAPALNAAARIGDGTAGLRVGYVRLAVGHANRLSLTKNRSRSDEENQERMPPSSAKTPPGMIRPSASSVSVSVRKGQGLSVKASRQPRRL